MTILYHAMQVIWIEYVEVKDCKVDDDDDIQSGTMNSHLAFNAKHWVNILSSICRRRCANRKIYFISLFFLFIILYIYLF